MNKDIKCNEFVLRQTPESGFSHFSGTWEELEDIVYQCWKVPSNVTPGYKDGVVLVRVPASGSYKRGYRFYSAIVKLNKRIKIDAEYSLRRAGEAPYIKLGAKAKKCIPKHVEIVLYRSDVLRENNEQSTDADWEIICIKARTSDKEDPMDPYTMARNFLHMKGGTKGEFTAEQFAESIVYWNNHVMCLRSTSWWDRIKKFFRGLTA